MFPITHTSLFSTYSHCFYAPASAAVLINAAAVPMLEVKATSKNDSESTIAKTLLAIIRSKNTLRRTRTYKLSEPLQMEFILYHYDP